PRSDSRTDRCGASVRLSGAASGSPARRSRTRRVTRLGVPSERTQPSFGQLSLRSARRGHGLTAAFTRTGQVEPTLQTGIDERDDTLIGNFLVPPVAGRVSPNVVAEIDA